MNDHQFVKRWEDIKEKGRLRYSLNQGLKYGVFLTVLMASMDTFKGVPFAVAFFSLTTLVKLLIFSVFGIFVFATFMWWLNSYFYKKMKK